MNIIYLLAYSWIAGCCVNKNYPGCLNKSDYWKNHFTIHGLWPQYVDNGYPEFCTDEPFNSTIPDLIGMDIMTKYWPNVEYEVNNPNYDSFYNHEWTKHGTCSLVNNQFDYFNSTIELAKKFRTPEILTEIKVTTTIQSDYLRDQFGGKEYVTLICSNTNILTGIYTCWDMNENGLPEEQIKCPVTVQKEDTCKTEEVVIFYDN